MTGVLLVTGASRGIGSAIALAGARAGYEVGVHFSTHPDAAEEICATIRAERGKAVALGCDIGSEAAIVALFVALDRSLFMNNGATAAAVAYDCSGLYVETDY